MGAYDGLTKHIGKAVENRQPKASLFSSFFATSDVHGENIVEFDAKDYTNGIAPFVEPTLDGKAIKMEGFATHIVKLPTMKPSKVLTSADLNKKVFGQSEDNTIAKNARARDLANVGVMNNEDRIDVRLETMRADVLFNGSLTIAGEGYYDSTITFPRNASHTVDLGAGNYWDEAGEDAKGDIVSFLKLLAQSGKTGTHIIGDQVTAGKLSALVATETDFRRVENGSLKFQSFLLVSGAIYYGTYLNVEIWGYDATYTNDAGATVAAVPAKKIVMLSAVNDNEMSFGYAGDIQLELDLAISVAISPRNVITKLISSRSSVEIESTLTAAPLLKDGNSTLVATVLV
tara:strand:- start:9841 stop:10875 length:1035 start_codon:yes stop_codon:yes gene_type:complete